MDLIYAGRYTEVCDYAWHDYANNNLKLPSGIWHVDTASIPEFFQRIDGNSNKYIVVSPSCDFGVCLQKYNHPAMDLEKWVGLQSNPGHGYNDLHMPARINRDRCNEYDTYSIKCWSYTEATFDVIPFNVVKWFLANCEIEDDRLIPIPFGIYGNKNQLETARIITDYPPQQRDKLLYINFQFYTTDRYRLYQHFNNYFGDLVTCKQDVPFGEFLHDLATHKYVLCPPGNGPDCYRTLETMYMGAVPIVAHSMGTLAPYINVEYPVLHYPNLFMCDPRGLDRLYEEVFSKRKQDLTKVLWPYWKDRIESCRSEL